MKKDTNTAFPTAQAPQDSDDVRSAQRIIQSILDTPPSCTDPNGSYTGRPQHADESPTQDADDL
ncbi:MAG: hypothetical protein RR075_05420 [Pygmaiobacter sp.]